jgi:multidrug efflux pump subunit AcrA (membrane-fusion protein)
VQIEQIAVYQTSLDTATLNLERTELKLPFAARVAEVSVEVGQYVGVGQVAARLDGIDAAEVVAQVPVAELLMLLQSARPEAGTFAGDPTTMTQKLRDLALFAEVQLLLGNEIVRWPAEVDRISDTIDQKTGTVGVILQVSTAYSSAEPGKRPPLTKGMFVRVILSAKPVTGIVVPRSALRSGQLLIAGDDNRLTLVPVTPFLVQDGIALITEGMEQGQRVVVSDVSPVISGLLLDVTQDDTLMVQLATEGQSK